MQKRRTALVCTIVCAAVSAALLLRVGAVVWRRGSTGSGVQKVQTRLQELGYYRGALDGIYGRQTEQAVRRFQSDYGLVVDGLTGEKTLAALGLGGGGTSGGTTSGSGVHGENDVELLARVISAEARGEPYVGQVAVGAVILNRIDHPSFPNTLAGVIYQPGAFSCLNDGQIDQPVAESAYRAARDAFAGSDPSGGAIYYFNPATATSKWIWSRPLLTVIGSHRFCA